MKHDRDDPTSYGFVVSERNYGALTPRCYDIVSAVGIEDRDGEKALETAREVWANTVRFDYGERYIDLKNAEQFRSVCTVSSVGRTLISHIEDHQDQRERTRCKIWARPCKARLGETSTAKAVEFRPDDCREHISVGGHVRPTLFWAKRSAETAWEKQVRAEHGRQFDRIESSKGEPDYRCIKSFLGQRCTVTAAPCRTSHD
jgi:hypothetical protein